MYYALILSRHSIFANLADNDFCSHVGPIVQRFNIGIGNIYAAVAHYVPEIVVPIGAVDIKVAAGLLFEHHIPSGIWIIITYAFIAYDRNFF